MTQAQEKELERDLTERNAPKEQFSTRLNVRSLRLLDEIVDVEKTNKAETIENAIEYLHTKLHIKNKIKKDTK